MPEIMVCSILWKKEENFQRHQTKRFTDSDDSAKSPDPWAPSFPFHISSHHWGELWRKPTNRHRMQAETTLSYLVALSLWFSCCIIGSFTTAQKLLSHKYDLVIKCTGFIMLFDMKSCALENPSLKNLELHKILLIFNIVTQEAMI